MSDQRAWHLVHESPLAEVLIELDALLDRPVEFLVIGAEARDQLAARYAPGARLAATVDVDLVLATSDWSEYAHVLEPVPAFGRRGMMFVVAGHRVDILPFGDVENANGIIEPPWMNQRFSMRGMSAVFAGATPATLRGSRQVRCRIPTLVGLAALKLTAWLEREPEGVTKDAGDFCALVTWFISEADTVATLVEYRSDLLRPPDFDLYAASAELMGQQIGALLGPGHTQQLVKSWNVDSRRRMVAASSSTRAGIPCQPIADGGLLLDRVHEGLAAAAELPSTRDQ